MRELELIYKLYEEGLSPCEEENLSSSSLLSEEKKDYYFSLFKENPARQESKKRKKVIRGDVYLMFLNYNDAVVPVYYVVYEGFDRNYEVFKMSSYWQLGAQNDFIVKVNNELFIIETWNRFYLTRSEILENSTYIGKISKEDFRTLENIADKFVEVPKDRRGLEVDLLDESYIQTKFHKKEAEIVREYKLRMFSLLAYEW